jgi:hypothetical protein
MKTKQISHHGWQGLPLRAGALALVLASTLLMGCASPRESNSANVSPVAAQSMQTRQQIAKAMFAERCKTAGEKIHRTVENVEGIFLMKLRIGTNYDQQFTLDDPYGHDSSGNEYIKNFLQGYYHQKKSPPIPGQPPQVGYLYVEAIDINDGQRYRYTGGIKEVTHVSSVMMGGDGRTTFKAKEFALDQIPATGNAPRYGVTYDDISTREEREYWIAGSSLKVIDLQTNEVLGERIGYMIDLAQGSRAGGRSPWLFAASNACPGFHRNPLLPAPRPAFSAQAGQTIVFIEKILKPTFNSVK